MRMLESIFNRLHLPHPIVGGVYEELEEERFEVVKGDVKTTIICKFNKEGFLVTYSSLSESIKESRILEVLKDELHEAIEKEDFETALQVQKKINKLREQEESKTKPTL